MKLTEKQWQVVAPLFAEEDRTGKAGRPPVPARDVLNGVLWILKTGARWKDLPRDYPPYQTCHRRFQTWVEEGTIVRALQVLADDLRERGKIDLSEAFIEGTFASAKKGSSGWPNEARKRDQDHGHCRCSRSSNLGLHCERFSTRSNAR